MVLDVDLRLFHLNFNFLWFQQTVLTLIRRRVLRRLIWVCTVGQCSNPSFTDNLLYTALWRHSDRNSATINDRYLNFVLTRGLISLVRDNHIDNYLKESLTFVPYSLIVNNRLKNKNRNFTASYIKIACLTLSKENKIMAFFQWKTSLFQIQNAIKVLATLL